MANLSAPGAESAVPPTPLAAADDSVATAAPSVMFAGVASGDASANSGVLWTLAIDASAPTASTLITAQISTSPTFDAFTSLTGATNPDANFTLKLALDALLPGTLYYYRFVGPAGETSIVGKFKTAPAPDTNAPLHLLLAATTMVSSGPTPSPACSLLRI